MESMSEKSGKILVELYDVASYKTGKEILTNPFTVKRLWAVGDPTVEIGSEKHGDIAIRFNDDGTIGITYFSPRIKIDADNVVPTKLTLNP